MPAPARRILRLALVILIVGVLVGAMAGLVTLFFRGVESVAFGYFENPARPGAVDAPVWRRFAAVIVACTIAAVVWWLIRTRARAVPSVQKAVTGTPMPWWETIVHAGLQIFIVGAGAPVGREVAPRELGALIGGGFARVFGLDARERTLVVAAAAGAGLAGVYNVPLAGALFTVEILLAELSLEAIGVALGASALAALVASIVEGGHAFYALPAVHASWSLAVFALIFGPAFGFLGYWFSHWTAWAERKKPSGAAILWLLPAASVIVAVVGIWLPQVMGNGRALGQYAFGSTSWAALGVLVFGFAAKSVLTLLTIRSGAAGGVLQPAIAVGAAAGAALGIGWALLWPGSPVAAFAILGGAALLAASQKAPLMALAIVFELTHAPFELLAPLGIAVAGSVLTRRLLEHAEDRAPRKLDI
ncbi:chloride channel protein [Gryllotalpicola protaetiae]|uniref:Chloride channel protein n=1 Tax=Gryllotalpicola protaetiae TaxID=2419771 RepID=A0A387BKG2_9MICO|nr:chloride channel protein [Gryllotalpicola protaetiae]AYG02654.1 chloride channel protein [Gryllotalpicola protaetiae]